MPELYSYQKDMSAWLQARTTGLLAADMGTGKTPTALHAADALGAKRILIIAPAVALVHWQREVQKWSPGREPIIGTMKTDRLAPEAGTFIVSYDRVVRGHLLRANLMRRRWDILILDEAHMCRGMSKRTRHIYGMRYDRGPGSIAHEADRVWLLTGTPLINHPGELWTHLRALAPDLSFRNYMDFVQAYCTTRPNPYANAPLITGGKNLAALREKLGNWLLRIRKADVAADMPPLHVEPFPVPAEKAKASLRTFESGAEAAAIRSLLDGAGDLTSPHLATLRRLTGMAKADAVVDLLDQEIDGGLEKVVIFAHHRDVMGRLADGLRHRGVVGISGSTPQGKRQAAIDRFQNDAKIAVFVGQLQAASTAISLTAASDVVFAEADWTPAINAQAIARCYRHGQTKPVLARFITLADSLDEAVMRAVAKKTETLTQLGLE